jgi:hypothetical protein
MFEGQRPSEKIIFILRKHPAVLFRPILWLSLLTLLPICAFVYFKFSWVFSYTFFFWLIFGGAYGLRTWYCFKESQYILTNERLICVEQKNFFHKSVSEADLSKIQEANYEVKGFWPSMLEFGNVEVHLYPPAGAKMILEQVEEPKKIQQQILNIMPLRHQSTERDQIEEREREESKMQKKTPRQESKKPAKEDDFWG